MSKTTRASVLLVLVLVLALVAVAVWRHEHASQLRPAASESVHAASVPTVPDAQRGKALLRTVCAPQRVKACLLLHAGAFGRHARLEQGRLCAGPHVCASIQLELGAAQLGSVVRARLGGELSAKELTELVAVFERRPAVIAVDGRTALQLPFVRSSSVHTFPAYWDHDKPFASVQLMTPTFGLGMPARAGATSPRHWYLAAVRTDAGWILSREARL